MTSQKKNPSLADSRYGKAEASPGFLFWKTFNKWSRRLRIELDQLGLTQVQYSILAALNYLASAKDHISQQDISDQLSMDKMMISDVVRSLEGKKMVVRKPNPHDGRSFSLSLTTKAKELLSKAVPVVEKTDELFFAALSPGQRKALIEALIQLSG